MPRSRRKAAFAQAKASFPNVDEQSAGWNATAKLDFHINDNYFTPEEPPSRPQTVTSRITLRSSLHGRTPVSSPIRIPNGSPPIPIPVSRSLRSKRQGVDELSPDCDSSKTSEDDFAVDLGRTSDINQGLSGSYVVRNSWGSEAIFKPQEEESTRPAEALQGNNPALLMAEPGSPLPPNSVPQKNGVVYGQATVKECAAYELDQASPLPVGVPLTRMHTAVVRGDRKRGSLQSFTPHKCSAEDMGPSSFQMEQVHHLGIFDIRLLNLDRHLGNLLVAPVESVPSNAVPSTPTSSFQPSSASSRSPFYAQRRGSVSSSGSIGAPRRYDLIPIDHGFSFPSYRDLSDVYLGWQYWRHCKQPFSDYTRERVRIFQPLSDAVLLTKHGLTSDSVIGCVFATLLVMLCVEDKDDGLDLNLFQIACLVQRKGPDDDDPTVLERALLLLDMESLVCRGAEVLPWLGGSDKPTKQWTNLCLRFRELTRQLATERLDL